MRIKPCSLVLTVILLGATLPFAIAQPDLQTPSPNGQYVPRLGEIMSAVQSQHHKLWLAAKAQNWELANYELRQLTAGLVQAAMLYSGIPVTNVTTLQTPLGSLADAIAAKDSRKFTKAMGDLTEGCNSCHRSMGRGFVVIRVPTELQPFGNQLFAPQAKP